jgi:hypothetical protein
MSRRVVVLILLEYVGSRQLFPMQETARRQEAELAGCLVVSPDWCSGIWSVTRLSY